MSPNKQNQPYSSHASAAGAYGMNAQKNASDPREVEARVLLKAAQQMVDLQNNWDTMTPDILDDTLKYNRNIWMMFYDTAVEDSSNARPKKINGNISNLASFIFKREIDIKAKPEKSKFDILISINRDIAEGLMKGSKAKYTNEDKPSGTEGTNKSA